MFEPEELELIKEGKRVQRTIFFALLATPIWLLIAVEKGRFTPALNQSVDTMFWSLAIVSALISLLCLGIHYRWVPRMMCRPRPIAAGDAVKTAVTRLRTAMILCLAFAESIMIYGLVLFAIGGVKFHSYLFMGWGLVVMLLCFPFPSRNEAYAQFLKENAQT